MSLVVENRTYADCHFETQGVFTVGALLKKPLLCERALAHPLGSAAWRTTLAEVLRENDDWFIAMPFRWHSSLFVPWVCRSCRDDWRHPAGIIPGRCRAGVPPPGDPGQ